jgi:hypothetical protein
MVRDFHGRTEGAGPISEALLVALGMVAIALAAWWATNRWRL